jgi:integrase
MNIRKRRDKWVVDLRYNGRRIRKTSPGATKREAEAFARRLQSELAERGTLERTESIGCELTFEEFWHTWFDEYVLANNGHCEQVTKRQAFKNHLQPVFGGTPLSQISRTSVEKFKSQLVKRGLKKKTINTLLSHLRRCLGEAEERELIERSPRISRLKNVEDPDWQFLTVDEVVKLVEASSELKHGAMVHMAARTGMRRGELRGLRHMALNYEQRYVDVRSSIVRMGHEKSTKSNKARKVPLTVDLIPRLLELERQGPFVFHENGQPLKQFHMERLLTKACELAGIRRVTWHVLRHTFASHLAQNGIPLFKVQKLLGHSTIQMTERYSHFSPNLDHAAVETLNWGTSRNIWSPNGHQTLPQPKNAPLGALSSRLF